jgi:SAM-dependent methyltransferase
MREPRLASNAVGGAETSYWAQGLDGLRRSWATLEPIERPVSDRLFELADIRAGDTVLDVATGIGEPALTIAARLGRSGRVIAIDQSADLLQCARGRAREAGVSNVEFRQMNAEAIDVPDGSLQAIVCRWGLMFVEDLAGGLRRMRCGLASGGRLAAAVWSDPGKVPIISVRRSVMRDLGLAALPVDPFSLSVPSRLTTALSAAGFNGISVERMDVAYRFRSVEEYVDHTRDLHGTRLGGLRERSPERQAEFWSALAAAARHYARPDGVVDMSSEVLLVTATT